MKRKIALLIIMLLTLTLVLVACNQTEPTSIRTRWGKEKHVFNVTLADFSDDSTADTFNYYDADGNLIVKTTDNQNFIYTKDIAFSGEFTNWDEIKPVAVSGTYIFEIIPSEDGTAYCDVKTEQVLYVKYNLKSDNAKGVDFELYSALRNVEASEEEYQSAGLTKEAGTTILKSTTTTTVRFENDPSQRPLNSSTKVNGFYIGKVTQQLSNYEIATEYDYSGKRAVAKITKNGESFEYKFAKNSAGNFIDSNQIMLYLRSLNKSSASFKDNPAIYVFNAYDQSLQTASFRMTYDYKVILTDTARSKSLLATNLTVLSVSVGNNAFLMQENLPDTLANTDKKLDVYSTPGGLESKFTTVRFRVGYFAYEIDYSNAANSAESTDWNDIWEALSPKTAE